MLSAAFEDVEHPVQCPLFALELHVRADVGTIDEGRLSDDTETLRSVLFDVLVRARVDEVQLEIWWEFAIFTGTGAGVGEEPCVDVVGAEVLDVAEGCGEVDEVGGRGGERGALGNEEARLVVDGAEEGYAAASLVRVEESG